MHPWLIPDEYVESISEIDPEALTARGIRAMLIDLDNTLVTWVSDEVSPAIEIWMRSIRDSGIGVCIVSNTRRYTRIETVAERLGIPHMARARKPRRSTFRKAMNLLGSTPQETAVVGDQLFTDVVGGHRIGAYTILCVPLPGREFPGTALVRRIERFILRRLLAKGHFRRLASESQAPEKAQRGKQAPASS